MITRSVLADLLQLITVLSRITIVYVGKRDTRYEVVGSVPNYDGGADDATVSDASSRTAVEPPDSVVHTELVANRQMAD